MTVTLHFQSTGTVPGSGQPARMVGRSLTVGRSDQNDLVLPDPDKVVSGRHCAIEERSGDIVVVDYSTNGTFLNYGKIALGDTPTPLNDGDILCIGTYELLVEIPAMARKDIPDDLPPLEDGPVSDGDAMGATGIGDLLDAPGDGDDFLDDLLGGPVGGPGEVVRDQIGDDGLMPPLGDDEADIMKPTIPDDADLGPSIASHSPATSDVISTPGPATSAIPDDWDLDLDDLGGSDEKLDDPFAEPEDASSPIPEETVAPQRRNAPVSPAPPASEASRDAAQSFLKALGADDLGIPETELEPTLARLGHVLRVMIHGVREILMTRASIKSEFRIHQTVISAGGNNPLKFSVSPEQAVEALAKPTTKGYLDPTEAVEQAMRDIKAHEVAMMTGMEAALKGVLARLEPGELAKVIEADTSFASILSNKKARYWDMFEAKYQEISDQAENDFHDLFSKEFARAYQEQLERLK